MGCLRATAPHAGLSDPCSLASSQDWDLDDPVVPSAASSQGGGPGTEATLKVVIVSVLRDLEMLCHSSKAFGLFWQNRMATRWMLLKFGIGLGCKGEDSPSDGTNQAPRLQVSHLESNPFPALRFIAFRLCNFIVNFFHQALLMLRKNCIFKMCIYLLWANLRMRYNSLGIWEIRY